MQVSIELLPLQVTVIVTSLADGTRSSDVRLPIFPSERLSSTKVEYIPETITGGSLTPWSPDMIRIVPLTVHVSISVLVVLHSNTPLLPGLIVAFPRNSVPELLHSCAQPKLVKEN